MHRTIVIGSVGYDRIWRLAEPFRRGGRLHVLSRDLQLGGGAFHTGSQLLELGATVAVVTRLMEDERGMAALAALREAGFDTGEVEMAPGETVSPDILLEPDGERTIIAPAHGGRPPYSCRGWVAGDAAYINALRLDAKLVAALDRIPLVLSQLPLRPATPRPADYIVSSCADAGGDMTDAWHRALDIAGPRLKMLVLTDGPRPITLFDGLRPVEVGAAPAVEGVSTIGAGDRFCGALIMSLLDGMDAAAAAAQASRRVADWLARERLPQVKPLENTARTGCTKNS